MAIVISFADHPKTHARRDAATCVTAKLFDARKDPSMIVPEQDWMMPARAMAAIWTDEELDGQHPAV